MNVLLLCFIVIVIPTINASNVTTTPNIETGVPISISKDPIKQQLSQLIEDVVSVVKTLNQTKKVNVDAAAKTISDVVKIHLDMITNGSVSYQQYQPETVNVINTAGVDSSTPPIATSQSPLPVGLENDHDFILKGTKLYNAISNFISNMKHNSTAGPLQYNATKTAVNEIDYEN